MLRIRDLSRGTCRDRVRKSHREERYVTTEGVKDREAIAFIVSILFLRAGSKGFSSVMASDGDYRKAN